MKRVIFLFLAEFLFSAELWAQDSLDTAGFVQDVSLIQLIVTPEKYHGKAVQLVGYLNVEFEGDAIYFHKEDFANSISRNGLWVDFPRKYRQEVKPERHSRNYVIIIGTFDMHSKGHGYLFAGTLRDIKRLDPWLIRRKE
jgi:hypothetical protein